MLKVERVAFLGPQGQVASHGEVGSKRRGCLLGQAVGKHTHTHTHARAHTHTLSPSLTHTSRRLNLANPPAFPAWRLGGCRPLLRTCK